MNFTEAINELDKLNEEILTEKRWVAIKPKNSTNYYKFLTLKDDTKIAADVADMLTVRRGTYKQTIDKDILAELIDELKKVSGSDKAAEYTAPANYEIEKDLSNINGKIKILTLADRSLRTDAHKTLNSILKNNTELAEVLKDALEGKKYLIHHINGDESKTTLDNIVLIPYDPSNKDTLKIANGIHGVLHGTGGQISVSSPKEQKISLFYFDENGHIKVGQCTVLITL